MMIFGAFAIFFTGYPHIWSLYQPYVMKSVGWTQSQASMCFYLALVTFVFGNIVGGRIQDKYNPRIAIVIGGGIFTMGILSSAFLILPSPIPMYWTYGVMQGFGQGMIYTTIISTAQKWFPDRIGFASGVVVTANGLCGFFLAPLSSRLLSMGGVRTAFLVIGMGIAISWVLGCVFIRNPEEELEKQLLTASVKLKKETGERVVHQYTSTEMVHTKQFYFLVATMMCGLMSYFLVSPISQIIQAERGISTAVAASAVVLGSVVNAVVRLCLPTLSDKMGRTKCIKGVLVTTMLAMLVLVSSKSYVTTVAVIVMYGCYGGIMGSFPSLTSSIFGLAHSGSNYGIVMAGIVMASLGAPMISSGVTRSGYGFQTSFMIGAMFAMAALMFLVLLEKELKQEPEIDIHQEESKCQL